MTERQQISGPPNVIATSDAENLRYMRVVLRDDQLDLIRLIVREEIERAKG